MTDLVPHLGERSPKKLDPLDFLASIPEHELWLQDKPSRQTRRSYARSVISFAEFAGVKSAALFLPIRRNQSPTSKKGRRHLEGG